MSLRAKTFLGAGLAMAVAMAALFALFEWRVMRLLAEREHSLARDRIRLVEKLYEAGLREMSSYAQGHSEWDVAADVLLHRDDAQKVKAFHEESFYAETMEEQRHAFAAMMTREGDIVFAVGDDGTAASVPPGLADALRPGGGAYPAAGRPSDEEVAGLLTIEGVPYVIVSQRVISHLPDAQRESLGRFVLGRRVKDDVLDAIRATTDFDLVAVGNRPQDLPDDGRAFIPAVDGTLPETIAAHGDGEEHARWVTSLADGTLAGGVVFNDLATNRPTWALWVRLPNDGVEAARTVRTFFLTSLAVLMLAVVVGCCWQVERLLLHPLATIQRALDRINRTGDRSLRVPVTGGAEFREHARRINETLAGLQTAEAEMAHRLVIEEALAEAARIVVRGGPDVLSKSLRTLGERLDVDVVSYYGMIAGRPDMMHCAGTFRDPATRTFGGVYRFDAPMADWIATAVRDGQPIVVRDTDALPPAMETLKTFVEEYGLKSLIATPVGGDGEERRGPGGIVGFGIVGREHEWSKEDLRALATMAELLNFGLHPTATPAANPPSDTSPSTKA